MSVIVAKITPGSPSIVDSVWSWISRIGGHCLPDRLSGRCHLVGRAELDELCSRLGSRCVTRWHIEGFAGHDGLLVVAVADSEATLEDETPVRTQTSAARKTAQHGREIVILTDRHEVDRVAVQILVAVHGDAKVLDE